MLPDLAVLSIADKTWVEVIPLFVSKSKAAAPETCGHAMEVPLMVADW